MFEEVDREEEARNEVRRELSAAAEETCSSSRGRLPVTQAQPSFEAEAVADSVEAESVLPPTSMAEEHKAGFAPVGRSTRRSRSQRIGARCRPAEAVQTIGRRSFEAGQGAEEVRHDLAVSGCDGAGHTRLRSRGVLPRPKNGWARGSLHE